MPDVFVFSSSTLTNIWAGIGAGLWGVSQKQADNRSIRTKSLRMAVGSLGVFWSVEDQSITAPFVVTSVSDQQLIERQVWDGDWHLPFGLKPLGTPRSRIQKSKLQEVVPTLVSGGKRWNQLFYVPPTYAFTPSKLSAADWSSIISRLAQA